MSAPSLKSILFVGSLGGFSHCEVQYMFKDKRIVPIHYGPSDPVRLLRYTTQRFHGFWHISVFLGLWSVCAVPGMFFACFSGDHLRVSKVYI